MPGRARSERAAGELKRHPSLDDRIDPAIRIVAYDPAWPTRAARELDRVRSAVGDVVDRLEHVGSTAVPGLPSKPIIDLLVSVEAVAPRGRYVEPLERIGYLFVPDPASPDFHFFAKPPRRPRAYHLHVCEAGGEHEARHLAVRDFLRTYEEEVERYAELKRELVARHPDDRLAYIEGKSDYMDALEGRALAWTCSGA